MATDARQRIERLLLTGDNRLKQGVAPEKIRESYSWPRACPGAPLVRVRPLIELRLADLERLARESSPPRPPAA